MCTNFLLSLQERSSKYLSLYPLRIQWEEKVETIMQMTTLKVAGPILYTCIFRFLFISSSHLAYVEEALPVKIRRHRHWVVLRCFREGLLSSL